MKNRNGTAVVNMWHCSTPQPDRINAGFPSLKDVKHHTIFRATKDAGGYNHHSQLVWHDGTFYAMWSNHPYAEDAPGMRVLGAISRDGKKWSSFLELFPPPGPVQRIDGVGANFSAGGWIVFEGRVWALANCQAVVRFRGKDENGKNVYSGKRDKQHPFPAHKLYSAFAREVRTDGSLGLMFPLGDKVPADLPFACADGKKTERSFSSEFWNIYLRSDKVPDPRELSRHQYTLASPKMDEMFARANQDRLLSRPQGVDSQRLCEPLIYKTSATHRMLMRDGNYSHRMYVCEFSPAKSKWGVGQPTNVPDSPSQSVALNLPNGSVLLIGNQMAPKFDNWDEIQHYKRSPLTVAFSHNGQVFTHVYSLRAGIPDFRVKGIFGGCAGGAQYPSAIVVEKKLHVQYSMGKQDIEISIVPLLSIVKNGMNSEQGNALDRR